MEKQPKVAKINHINAEGLKRAGKKTDRKGSSKFIKIILGLLISGGIIVGVWKGIPYVKDNYITPEIPYSITDTINMNADETLLDELLSTDKYSTLLNQVIQLEAYLEISNKLADLNLSSYTEAVAEVTESDNFDADLHAKYDEFIELVQSIDSDVLSQEALRLHQLAAELNGYKQIIDSKITVDGYNTLANYGILVAKTAVLDASGIGYENIDNLRIPHEADNEEDTVIIYTDPNTGKKFRIKIANNSIIRGVIDDVYRAQTKDTTELTTDQIIGDLTGYLNDFKVATFMRYANDGTLTTTNNYGDVREVTSKVKVKSK